MFLRKQNQMIQVARARSCIYVCSVVSCFVEPCKKSDGSQVFVALIFSTAMLVAYANCNPYLNKARKRMWCFCVLFILHVSALISATCRCAYFCLCRSCLSFSHSFCLFCRFWRYRPIGFIYRAGGLHLRVLFHSFL